LKGSEQVQFRSASAEEFVEGMKELHSRIKERLQSSSQECKIDQINTGRIIMMVKWKGQEHRIQRHGQPTKFMNFSQSMRTTRKAPPHTF
jgi:hypothetical protein